MNKLLKISFFSLLMAVCSLSKAQVNQTPVPVTVDVLLPKGYSATEVSLTSNAGQSVKTEFLKKSGGKSTYTVYRDDKGNVVTEQEVKTKYIEENKNVKQPAMHPVINNAK
jgi:hypothetical protein